jgi:hypothetical protein
VLVPDSVKGVPEPVKRLAILWLTCAVVGFLAAVGAAYVLSLAVDGAGAWHGRRPDQPPPAATNAPGNAAASAPPAVVATALNRGGH